MAVNNKYIRFDWAVKRMLRDKANFLVLEGLIAVLTGTKVTITEMLEGESNPKRATDRLNRLDVKAKNEQGEIVFVEIQVVRKLYYLQHVVQGGAMAISEYIQTGDCYNQVKKVYSISIVYFDIGKGNDYLYYGKTAFTGVHTGDCLQMKASEQDEIAIKMRVPEHVFPEYYIIRVDEFGDVVRTPIDEWLDYLKNNHIKDDTMTPGLCEVKEKFLCAMMDDRERRAYEAHIDNIMVQNDVLDAARIEGYAVGRAEGRAETEKNAVAGCR